MLPAPPSSAPGGTSVPPATGPDGAPHRSPTGRRTTWILAGATVAGCVYVAVADPNSSASWYPQCPFKALTGLDCPGCGVTRAIHATLTGHPLRALDHNALVVVGVVLAAVWFGLSWLRRRRGQAPARIRHPAVWAVALGVVVVAFWVVRNLSWGPFHWLGSGATGA